MMKRIGLGLIGLFFAANANATGFEKSVMWSGKYAGTGGNAVSSVSGSQSLYFNPAGLAGQSDVSLNYSPTWINVDGSLVTVNRTDKSRPGVIPSGGAFASYGAGRFGFGAGAYVAGGEKAIYPDVDLSPDSGNNGLVYRPLLETDLQIVEYSLGAAYEVIPGLRIGAAWRISQAKGSLATIKRSTSFAFPVYSHLAILDAKETRYNGYRVGAMYQDQDDKWGVGASYRSQIKFDAPGTGRGATIVSPTTSVTQQVVTGTRVGVTFPSAISFGGHYGVLESLRVLAGADFVKYSADDNVYITGTANGSTLPNIALNWKDMWNVRFGLEYTGFQSLAIRAGYVRTSQVTSEKDAKATLPPAGTGSLYTLGFGYGLMTNLDLDLAGEYGHVEGMGAMTSASGGFKELLSDMPTMTSASSYAVHTGVTYRF